MCKMIFIFFIFFNVFCFSYETEKIFIQKNMKDNGKLKIAMVTVIINEEKNFEQIVSFGTRSKEVYAKKHGYDFIIAKEKLNTCYGVEPTRPLKAAWTKLALISRFLDNYDWVFLTDADSIILNFDIKLEDFIDNNFDIIACTEDKNMLYPFVYNQRSYINTGQVFYRNSQTAKNIILGAWKNHAPETPYSWEQARINDFIKTHKLCEHIKVHPPKDFNLTPSQYQYGDFIVHMYGYHTLGGAWHSLVNVMNDFEKKYGFILEKVEHELNMCQSETSIEYPNSLDEYIQKKGSFQIEGHVCLGGTTQPKYFEDLLLKNPQILLVGEVGFNAGHSSEIFLKARSDISVISFDIMTHPYVIYGKQYIDLKYPDRHLLIPGNSLVSLPNFYQKHKDLKFDLIFIDGGHSYDAVLNDIINCRIFAHSKTILVIDDMSFTQIAKVWKKCVSDGIITHGNLLQSKHKKWIECKYFIENE